MIRQLIIIGTKFNSFVEIGNRKTSGKLAGLAMFRYLQCSMIIGNLEADRQLIWILWQQRMVTFGGRLRFHLDFPESCRSWRRSQFTSIPEFLNGNFSTFIKHTVCFSRISNSLEKADSDYNAQSFCETRNSFASI